MSKYYRDLQPGETLQAGDEKRQWPLEWAPVHPAFYGATLSATFLLEYRRPVDLPVLQRVTPEAMAELEGRHGYVTFFTHSRSVRCIYSPSQQRWWDDENIQVINPLEWQWFIDLSTIPEVQQ